MALAPTGPRDSGRKSLSELAGRAAAPAQTPTAGRAATATPVPPDRLEIGPSKGLPLSKPRLATLAAAGAVARGVGVPEQKVEEVTKGKEKGLIGKIAYLPFYPVDKILELEELIPSAINQIQNLREGKAVDIGSITDPFGDKGIITEVGRLVRNAPRKTEFFQDSQDFAGYTKVFDNPALAFTASVFGAPTTYLTGGVAAVSKGALLSIAKGGAKKAISETGEALTKNAAKQIAREAAEAAAQRELADITARGALAGADDLVRAEQNLTRATKAADKARAAVLAEEASEEILLKNIQDYARSAGRKAPGRTYGARAREATAADLVEVADEARRTLADPAKLAAMTPKQREAVELISNTLTEGFIGDVATKGYSAIRGEAADALLVRGGFKWGVGQNKVWVPLTEGLTNAFGSAATAVRVGTGVERSLTGFGPVDRLVANGLQGLDSYGALTKWATNVGRKGIAGEKTIRDLRASLRTGEAKGEQAAEAIRTLAVDRTYRRNFAGQKGVLDAVLSPMYANAAADRAFAGTVSELIENPDIRLFDSVVGGVKVGPDDAATVSRKLGRTVTEQELDLARRASASFEEMYDEANGLYREVQLRSGVKAEDIRALPKTNNYFPHVPTQKAVDWAETTKGKESLLGYDRTMLGALGSPRRLIAGNKIGSYTLTPEDIAGGVKRLNEIYRKEFGIKFDFFETNIGTAAAKQAEKVAADMAFLRTVLDEIEEGKAFRALSKKEQAIRPMTKDLEAIIESSLTPQKLTVINTIPDALDELNSIVAQIDDLENLTRAPSKAGLANEVEELKQNIIDAADTLSRRGDVTGASTGAVVTFEADALAESLMNQAKGITTNVLSRPVTEWRKIVPVIDDGFVLLNSKILPDIQAQRQLAEIIRNGERFNDPKFVRALNRYMGNLNRFFKSWVTATPGFHTRNALSNAFFMTFAGADINNVNEAAKIYNKWLKYSAKFKEKEVAPTLITKAGIRRGPLAGALETVPGISSLQIYKFVTDDVAKGGLGYTIGTKEAYRVSTALENVGVAGFGRTTEVFETGARGLGAGTSVFGGEATNALTRTLGKPLQWSRSAGETIENYSRFALTYDGIAKGLSAEQAAARTARYLIDYQDISRADEVIKQIIPFWMWVSRAVPLLVESMLTRPRAFAVYENIKAGLRDEDEESTMLPPWMAKGGAFKAPFNLGGSTYLQPDLGFTGLGEDIESLTSPIGLLNQVNPFMKAPLEAWLNYDTFRKQQIANKEFDPEADKKIRNYLVSQYSVLGPVMQRYARATAATAEILNQDSFAEFVRKNANIDPSDYLRSQGITEPEMAQNINTLASFLGIPVRNLLDYQEQDVFEDRQKRLQELARMRIREQQGR